MRYILILVGLGVIFSGGLFALSRMPTEEVVTEAPANSTDQQIPEERTHEVVLREDGFDLAVMLDLTRDQDGQP